MVTKTPNSGLHSLRNGQAPQASCGYHFPSSLSPCKVGTVGPISQMRKVRLRKFKKLAPNNHSAHLFYVFANSLNVFHSIHTLGA